VLPEGAHDGQAVDSRLESLGLLATVLDAMGEVVDRHVLGDGP